MQQIKVIHVVEDLKIGGMERIIADIVSSLNPKKFQCQVWCVTRGGAIADSLIAKGVVVRIHHIVSYRNPFSFIELASQLRAEKADPNIVRERRSGT